VSGNIPHNTKKNDVEEGAKIELKLILFKNLESADRGRERLDARIVKREI